MSEPLTKDKLFVMDYDLQYSLKEIKEDPNLKLRFCESLKNSEINLTLEDLKSALEEFEKLIKLWSTSEIVYCRVKDDLKKAFPAIYEKDGE